MGHTKLSARHAKAIERDDIVTRKAEELRITPEEVFARSYVEGGMSRSTADRHFQEYCTKEGAKKIPQIVIDFCEKPIPKCGNPSCPTPDIPARFTRTGAKKGKTMYFCSVVCMDSTPKEEEVDDSVANAMEGREILKRVQVAMGKSIHVRVPTRKVRPMKGQPRVFFNPERMERLVDSFRSVGQITPGIIRRVELDENNCDYELLDGERRLRSAQIAEVPEYSAMLIEIDDEAAPFVVSVIANFNREEHTLLELTDAVVRMHEGLKLKMHEIASVLGLSSYIEASKLYGLRRLIPEVRDMLDPNITKGKLLPKGAAIQISQVDEKDQLPLANKMITRELTLGSLREHVRHAAESRGVYMPKRNIHPDDLRKSVRRRTEAINRGLQELERILSEDATKEAMIGFEPIIIRGIDATMTESQKILSSCAEKIKKALPPKK